MKRGFKRLGIALFGLWELWWVLTYFDPGYDPYGEHRELAVAFGVILPLAIGIPVVLAWWVYRGFRPKV